MRASSPWEKLLRPPKEVRSPAAKRYKQERFVLNYLRAKRPDIFAGEPGVIVSRQESDDMVAHMKLKASGYNFKHRVQLLIRILQRGNENLGWEAAVPSPPVIVPREISRYTPDLFSELQKLRLLESAFLKDLEKPIPDTVSACLGQTILSAIIYGGLLYTKWHEPWISALNSGIRTFENLLWLDMETKIPIRWYKENTENNTKKKPKIEEYWLVRRRWFADPLTHALILRLMSHYHDDLLNLQHSPNPWQCLQYYLRTLGLDKKALPENMNALIRSASARLGLSVQPYLISFATGRTSSVSMPAEAWTRLINGASVPYGSREPIGQEALSEIEEITIDQQCAKISMAQQQKLLIKLEKAVSPYQDYSKRTHAESHEDIGKFWEEYAGTLVPVIQLLKHWATYRLTHHADLGINYQKRLRPSSARTYLQKIGSVLLAEAGDRNILTMEPEELQELYLDATRSKGSETMRADCARVLSLFHRYLIMNHNAPIIDFGEILGQSVPDEMRVDANLIAPASFDNVVHVLHGDTMSLSRSQQMRILIATLGFRCGLRRSEVRKICLTDIVGRTDPELLIRSNRYAYAKSNDSVRKIPLRPLLSAKEFKKLSGWLELRRSEDNSALANSLLFCEFGRPNQMLSNDVFASIELVMRQVTGDGSLRFHHLRHSFVNWMLVRLSGVNAVEGERQPDFLNHPLFCEKSCLAANRALLPNDPLGRQTLYAVSQLCGHASPETTLSTYIHLCDYLLGRELARPELQPELTEKAIMQITGLKRARIFRIRQHSQLSGWSVADFHGGMHKHSKSSLADPLLMIAKEPDLTPCKETAVSDIPHWTLLQAIIEKSQRYDVSVNQIADDFDVLSKGFSSDDVHRWCQTAANIRNMKTSADNYRHYDADILNRLGKVFPVRPHQRSDIALVENIFKVVSRMSADERQVLRWGLTTFITRFCMGNWSLRLGKIDDVRKFLSFLQLLGISKSSVRLIHYPGPNISDEHSRLHRLRWTKVLGLQPDQCIPAGKGNRTGYMDFGSVGIQVRSKYGADVSGKGTVRYGVSYGLRYGVYMLVIVLGVETDFGRMDDK